MTGKNIIIKQFTKMKHQNLIGQKMKTFNFHKILGEGSWAIVYEAIDENSEEPVAIKVIPKILIKQNPKLLELVKAEINILRQCKNENVVKFISNFMSQKSIMIAIQYCNGGDLQHYLKQKKRLSEDQANQFLKQILNGFKGLHEVNAMHRDFKTANVLMHDGVCKIADLGFAKQMERQALTDTILGTSLTMAPEVLNEQPYGRQADIWSLGVVYYQMLYGKYPYTGRDDKAILESIKMNRPSYKEVNISSKALDFIERCLTVNAKQRITWKQIYDHPLIAKENSKIIFNLNSKINFAANKKFYESHEEILNNELMYLDKKISKKQSNLEEDYEAAEIKKAQKIDNIIESANEKKKMNAVLQRYEKRYLNRRNSIMFIFKFITPFVFNLYSINATHGITMYILSKKVYFDMKELYTNLVKKVNFLNISPNFETFVKSYFYETLINTIKSDLDIILAQMTSYKEDISSCSKEVADELQVTQIHSSNWERFVNDINYEYTFQLGVSLDQAKGNQKKDIIRVIEALNFYRLNSNNSDIQEFTQIMDNLDFSKVEARVIKHIQQKLKGF